MMNAAAVAMVVNGAVVSSAFAAEIDAGRVVAPTALIARFADRVTYDEADKTVTIERDGRRIAVPVTFLRSGEPYVVVTPVVRGLGGRLGFDTAAKVVSIELGGPAPIATLAPVTASPFPGPPELPVSPVPTPTPRAIESGIPHPRRTAIPAVPSQPGPPSGPVTGPRR